MQNWNDYPIKVNGGKLFEIPATLIEGNDDEEQSASASGGATHSPLTPLNINTHQKLSQFYCLENEEVSVVQNYRGENRFIKIDKRIDGYVNVQCAESRIRNAKIQFRYIRVMNNIPIENVSVYFFKKEGTEENNAHGFLNESIHLHVVIQENDMPVLFIQDGYIDNKLIANYNLPDGHAEKKFTTLYQLIRKDFKTTIFDEPNPFST